jgi:hypothetical protein
MGGTDERPSENKRKNSSVKERDFDIHGKIVRERK